MGKLILLTTNKPKNFQEFIIQIYDDAEKEAKKRLEEWKRDPNEYYDRKIIEFMKKQKKSISSQTMSIMLNISKEKSKRAIVIFERRKSYSYDY